MAIIEKTGVLTYLDGDGNEVRLYPESKNGSSDAADAVISVLSSDWALDQTTGMYKQDFTVNGITSESVPVIGLVPTGTPTPDAEAEAYSHITDAVTGDNTLTLYADEALTTAITIIIKGIGATGGSTVADISDLTAAYNELNSNLEEMKTYSSEETAIGKWIDGKTIYRKIYHSNNVSITGYVITIDDSFKSTNVDTMVLFNETLKIGNYDWQGHHDATVNGTRSNAYFVLQNSGLKLFVGDVPTIAEYTLVMEYTKP